MFKCVCAKGHSTLDHFFTVHFTHDFKETKSWQELSHFWQTEDPKVASFELCDTQTRHHPIIYSVIVALTQSLWLMRN